MTVKITCTHWDSSKRQTQILFAFDGNGIFSLFLSHVYYLYIKLDSKLTVLVSLPFILFRFYLKYNIHETLFRMLTLRLNNIQQAFNPGKKYCNFFYPAMPDLTQGMQFFASLKLCVCMDDIYRNLMRIKYQSSKCFSMGKR